MSLPAGVAAERFVPEAEVVDTFLAGPRDFLPLAPLADRLVFRAAVFVARADVAVFLVADFVARADVPVFLVTVFLAIRTPVNSGWPALATRAHHRSV